MADPEPTNRIHLSHSNYGMKVVSDGPFFWIAICDICHYVEAQCTHKNMEWRQVRPPDPLNREDNGKELICQTCGINGT